ncbi:Alpha-mannosidase G [Chionoecetes opilio]|uniref:alpha-mannosidase n=1 Tax=Chionoecetes opilio TaxID=41210 RepID=A0A8J4YSQ0_CHIOP|nr:Alpha-mannosidase G [Chionoecetes opilio]
MHSPDEPARSSLLRTVTLETIMTPCLGSHHLRRVKEAIHTVSNLQDKGRVSTSAFLYGHGDGGGGPTRTMLERGRRLKDVHGCPRMQHMSPSAFFERLEAEKHNLCRWVGELYLELHNGTYTSQAKTKSQNRQCEFALRDAELLLAVVAVKGKMAKKKLHLHQDDLCDAWKKVLLNQFHDVIPGTSIGRVYCDADRLYREALDTTERVRDACFSLLFKEQNEKEESMVVVNTLPWPVWQVVEVEEEGREEPCRKAGRLEGEATQSVGAGQRYVAVEAAGMGWARLSSSCLNPPPVTVSFSNNKYTLENQYMRAEINMHGTVESLRVAGGSQDVFRRDGSPAGLGNQLVLFDDIPLYWDAWDTMDYHLETARVMNTKVRSRNVCGRWRCQLSILTWSSGAKWTGMRVASSSRSRSTLPSLPERATFDSQFGFVERNTHSNTQWDSAKFEVCGHKWADLSEPGLGVAVLNDCKYGWTARGGTLMLSLLRSPKAPDANCDMGAHTFSYALMPHKGYGDRARVQRHAYEFNNKLTLLPASVGLVPHASRGGEVWFSLVGDGAMIEAVKLAEDKSGDVVVRVYETLGNATCVRLQVSQQPPPLKACLCNGLEEPLSDLTLCHDDDQVFVDLALSPFKIANIRITYG